MKTDHRFRYLSAEGDRVGVATIIESEGTDILNAIRENNFQKFKNILEKHVRTSRIFIRLCTSDIKHKPSKQFACPVMLAARQEDPRILRYMLDNGVDANFKHRTIFNSKRRKRITPLHVAVDLSFYQIVEVLLTAKANCNIGDHNQETPLHIAAKKADWTMVELLLSRGADPSIRDCHGNAALHIATKYGHLQLVHTLLQYGADMYQKGEWGNIPPLIAAKEGHTHLIQLFCSRDIGYINSKIPCYKDQRVKSPIHLAAEHGHVETVQVLLDQFNAEVNLQDSDGNTPLHCVVLNQHNSNCQPNQEHYKETAKVLIKYKVNINEKNLFGDTALHLAAKNQLQQIIEILLRAGADPFIMNESKLKPIDLVLDSDPVTRNVLRLAMLKPMSSRKSFNESTDSETILGENLYKEKGVSQQIQLYTVKESSTAPSSVRSIDEFMDDDSIDKNQPESCSLPEIPDEVSASYTSIDSSEDPYGNLPPQIHHTDIRSAIHDMVRQMTEPIPSPNVRGQEGEGEQVFEEPVIATAKTHTEQQRDASGEPDTKQWKIDEAVAVTVTNQKSEERTSQIMEIEQYIPLSQIEERVRTHQRDHELYHSIINEENQKGKLQQEQAHLQEREQKLRETVVDEPQKSFYQNLKDRRARQEAEAKRLKPEVIYENLENLKRNQEQDQSFTRQDPTPSKLIKHQPDENGGSGISMRGSCYIQRTEESQIHMTVSGEYPVDYNIRMKEIARARFFNTPSAVTESSSELSRQLSGSQEVQMNEDQIQVKEIPSPPLNAERPVPPCGSQEEVPRDPKHSFTSGLTPSGTQEEFTYRKPGDEGLLFMSAKLTKSTDSRALNDNAELSGFEEVHLTRDDQKDINIDTVIHKGQYLPVAKSDKKGLDKPQLLSKAADVRISERTLTDVSSKEPLTEEAGMDAKREYNEVSFNLKLRANEKMPQTISGTHRKPGFETCNAVVESGPEPFSGGQQAQVVPSETQSNCHPRDDQTYKEKDSYQCILQGTQPAVTQQRKPDAKGISPVLAECINLPPSHRGFKDTIPLQHNSDIERYKSFLAGEQSISSDSISSTSAVTSVHAGIYDSPTKRILDPKNDKPAQQGEGNVDAATGLVARMEHDSLNKDINVSGNYHVDEPKTELQTRPESLQKGTIEEVVYQHSEYTGLDGFFTYSQDSGQPWQKASQAQGTRGPNLYYRQTVQKLVQQSRFDPRFRPSSPYLYPPGPEFRPAAPQTQVCYTKVPPRTSSTSAQLQNKPVVYQGKTYRAYSPGTSSVPSMANSLGLDRGPSLELMPSQPGSHPDKIKSSQTSTAKKILHEGNPYPQENDNNDTSSDISGSICSITSFEDDLSAVISEAARRRRQIQREKQRQKKRDRALNDGSKKKKVPTATLR